ncbi:ABC transporter permease [Parenemella sanctibonifatiensis]|uniref:ABC transporter permease n=1 Tax=Parenemella sanctibonifatiensis TaxID=2016505 RepID=A0A255E4G1_9ACTN|nr:ABC transporter permease [Parenemella sanctibonifatiensis]OYN86458.1 ABC transporter permease [Parenemella sanctibonifatiensis]
MNRRLLRVLLPTATILLVLAGVEVATRVGAINARHAPPPSEVLATLVSELGSGDIWAATGNTLIGWAMALLVAVLLGTVVGVILGSSVRISAFFRPAVEFLRPIPSIAMIPLAVALIGTQRPTELFLAGYAAFWQMLIATLAAVGSLDPVGRQTAVAYNLPRLAQLRHVVLPSLLPGLATGVRISSATALIIVITTEILIGTPGLGADLSAARAVGNLHLMYAHVLVIGLLGLALTSGISAVEDRLLFWHESRRGKR